MDCLATWRKLGGVVGRSATGWRVLVPIDKSALMAPWIGLASLITVATASIIYVKHRKKTQP